MPKYVDIENAKEYVNLSNEAFISLKGFYVIPKNTPAADVAPIVHGLWESDETLCEECKTRCSVCKTEYEWSDLDNIRSGYIVPYCPNCGTKMNDD